MTTTDTRDICCAALELSQTKWLCAFAVPGTDRPRLQMFKAGDARGLIAWVRHQAARAEASLSRPLTLVLCYEVGYDGFWLARWLIREGIQTIVFDPASFLRPRRGRVAKTDRLDAEAMTRTLRAWLGGDHSIAREVRIPSVEEEDAKRLARERKHLVEERTRLVGRIKGLCALQGVSTRGNKISKRWAASLDHLETGDGRPLPPYLRRELERLLRRYEFVTELIEQIEQECEVAISDEHSSFPHKEKVLRLATLGGVGPTSAILMVAEVFQRTFQTRKHLASFLGLAPSPHASGDVSRDRGISKAGAKLARRTLVELSWAWLRYQPGSQLAIWWRARFGTRGMRARKIGIVALARKLAIAFWRFLEAGVIPEGASLKA
jgi:transposase